MEAAQTSLQRKVHELHSLDFEGVAGGVQTRFKYRKVKPDSFGLTAADILNAEDKELTQLVSIKKLAPYRDTAWVVPVRKQQRWKKEMRGQWKKAAEALARGPRKDKEQHVEEGDDGEGSNSEGEDEKVASAAAPAEPAKAKRKRKKKGKKRARGEAGAGEQQEADGAAGDGNVLAQERAQPPAGKKKRKRKHGSAAAASKHGMSQARLSAYGL